jgi:hypothetical protein
MEEAMPFSIRLFGKLRVEREGQLLSIPREAA